MGLHGRCRSVYACVRIGYNNQVSCSGDYIAISCCYQIGPVFISDFALSPLGQQRQKGQWMLNFVLILAGDIDVVCSAYSVKFCNYLCVNLSLSLSFCLSLSTHGMQVVNSSG